MSLLGCSESRATEPAPVPPPAAPASAPVADSASTVEPAPSSTPPAHEPEPAPAGPRIYAKARFAWIQAAPRGSKGWVGYISLGGSVALRGATAEAAKVVGGDGCAAWYAIEPQGYVCAGDSATVDPQDPVVVALAKDAPKIDTPWPYEYGESTGAPRYEKIPSVLDQKQTEWDLEKHEAAIERARNGAATAKDTDVVGLDLAPAGVDAPELFPFGGLVRESRKFVAPGSTVAWTRQFDAAGRTFLLTPDKLVVPKDRVKPYKRSEFHGVELTDEVKLPIAFFRKKDRPKYDKRDGAFVATEQAWPRLAWVQVTGAREVDAKGQAYLPTKDGAYALESDATVASEAKSAPWVSPEKKGRQTWLDVSVLGGWLVAYEGMKPVFTTLISPGRGGVPQGDLDPLTTASTPTGTFRVDGKFVTATMVSSTNDMIVHTDVQFVQNFHGPHALHGAYWHDGWGEPKSGGCINLSPIDAKRVFEWTEPSLPKDWYGLRSVPEMGAATIVDVHK